MTDEELKFKYDHILTRLRALEDCVSELQQLIQALIADGDTIELVCCWGGDPRKRPNYIVKRVAKK